MSNSLTLFEKSLKMFHSTESHAERNQESGASDGTKFSRKMFIREHADRRSFIELTCINIELLLKYSD